MFMVLGYTFLDEVSLPPVVQSFTLASANPRVTVTAVGQNFSTTALQNYEVRFRYRDGYGCHGDVVYADSIQETHRQGQPST
jgi:hypothetical protein